MCMRTEMWMEKSSWSLNQFHLLCKQLEATFFIAEMPEVEKKPSHIRSDCWWSKVHITAVITASTLYIDRNKQNICP